MAHLHERLARALRDRYDVRSPVGAGGMAIVYRARDRKHDREVAIKVLRPELAAALGGDRFLREIRTAAQLNHPHILPLHDSGEADGLLFYVMPYLPGESLRDRLSREKQLQVGEAVRLTREVAAALEYAHRHGIIHRDVKPENILLHDGQALVADFGIALAVRAAGGERLTETGLSVGTPQYMSPEQAMGERKLDPRSDVYSLGCVLYEMLAGTPPHTGPTAQAVLAKTVTEPAPDVRTVRDRVSQTLAGTLRRALEKVPADRFESAKAFADALDRSAAVPDAPPTPVDAGTAPTRAATRAAVPWGLVVIATGVALWAWSRSSDNSVPVRAATRFVVPLPVSRVIADAASGSRVALSPDGRHLVYVGQDEQEIRLFHRPLDGLPVQPLPGSEGAAAPFFSPDGRWLGFLARGALYRMRFPEGPPVRITDASPDLRGATWGPDDTIVFSQSRTAGLSAVSASGGTPRPLTTPDTAAGERGHVWPSFLPAGNAVLFTITPSTLTIADASIAVVSLESGQITHLARGATAPAFIAERELLVYATPDGTLLAAPLDAGRWRITAPAVPLLDGVSVRGGGGADVAFSQNGTLAFLPDGRDSARLTEVARDGSSRLLSSEQRTFRAPRYSPDGRHVAVVVESGADSDVWLLNLARQSLNRLTFNGGAQYPTWTPTGDHIVHAGRAQRGMALFRQPVSGSTPGERVFEPDDADAWEGVLSPDGRRLAVRVTRRGSLARDIGVVDLGGGATYRPILATAFDERSPMLSPDGRWLAYVSDESGRSEVYVQRFPEGGARWQVSAQGGTEPLWAPDGREIFYRSGNRVMVVEVSFEPEFAPGNRRALLQGVYTANPSHTNYDVHPDGSRFVFVQPGRWQSLVVVLDWVAELTDDRARPAR